MANSVKPIGLCRDGDRVCGVAVRDLVSGKDLKIRGSAVPNAAGLWAAHVHRGTLTDQDLPQVRFSRDAYFVVSQCLSSRLGLAVPGGTNDLETLLRRMTSVLWNSAPSEIC